MPLPCFCGDGQNPNPPRLTALMETDCWEKSQACYRFSDALNDEKRSVIIISSCAQFDLIPEQEKVILIAGARPKNSPSFYC